jgi:HD superfamily phosphodiesterase
MTVNFESAELQYKQILEDYFVSVYNEKSLPSHGIEHHRRVWKYAKELALLLNKHNIFSDHEFTHKLIIACYLHDIGMSVDAGIKHGIHSRELCVRFLTENSIPVVDYQDLLEAVENHDNKEYSSSSNKSGLLTILSVADDLDAFGFIGIYRYSEIYIARGINLKQIGNLIKENASKRFNNFEKIFGFDKEIIRKHKKRYEILYNFFSEYNNQAKTYKFGGTRPSGYCGVIEIFKAIIQEKGSLNDIMVYAKNYRNDPVIQCFLEGLLYEIEVNPSWNNNFATKAQRH